MYKPCLIDLLVGLIFFTPLAPVNTTNKKLLLKNKHNNLL